jgi:hypothetical protein
MYLDLDIRFNFKSEDSWLRALLPCTFSMCVTLLGCTTCRMPVQFQVTTSNGRKLAVGLVLQ